MLFTKINQQDLCRVAPANVTRQEIDKRNRNSLKLTGLPFSTTAYDLNELLKKVDAKTCFILRTKNQYGRGRYAYIMFKTEETCLKMLNNEIQGCVNETVLYWIHANVKTCHKCESMEHLVIECQEKKDNNEFKQEEMVIIEFIQGIGYQTTKTWQNQHIIQSTNSKKKKQMLMSIKR